MKENFTHIVFLLDRSGSMYDLTKETIGGYNSFINQQRKLEKKAIVTTVLFDDEYEILHDGVDIKNIENLTEKEYYARGCTALLDAIGKTIINTSKGNMKEGNVIFVITTDGHENASMEFRRDDIKKMIKDKSDKHNWQFMFLGANIDAVAEAESIGIRKEFSSNYEADSEGTEKMYNTLCEVVKIYRECSEIKEDWKESIK